MERFSVAGNVKARHVSPDFRHHYTALIPSCQSAPSAKLQLPDIISAIVVSMKNVSVTHAEVSQLRASATGSTQLLNCSRALKFPLKSAISIARLQIYDLRVYFAQSLLVTTRPDEHRALR